MHRNQEMSTSRPITYIVEYLNTDSDDYSRKGWGLVTCEVREDPIDEVVSAVKERIIEEVFSKEAIEMSDTPERADADAVYHMWLDYEAALSDEEIQEAEETGEWPDIEASTELVQFLSARRATEGAIEEYADRHGEPAFEYDTTE